METDVQTQSPSGGEVSWLKGDPYDIAHRTFKAGMETGSYYMADYLYCVVEQAVRSSLPKEQILEKVRTALEKSRQRVEDTQSVLPNQPRAD